MTEPRRGMQPHRPSEVSTHDEPVASVEDVQASIGRFLAEYPDLTLYATMCRAVVDDSEAASLLLTARPGQARPVLLLAALHDLVLADPSVPAARWYPSVVGRAAVPSQGDAWPDVRATLLGHAGTIRHTIATRSTQTNEVNRATYLATMLALGCADVDRPVALLELGASAGLLLGVDRYAVELTSQDGVLTLGDETSSVRCPGRLAATGGVPPLVLPRVVSRVGLDLDPVDLTDAREARWLKACLWPDVPRRIERFTSAVEQLIADPPHLMTGDLIDDLPRAADEALRRAEAEGTTDAHLVAFTSWSLTYVRSDRRPAVLDVLSAVAAHGTPVTWLTAEPPGCAPGIPNPTARRLDGSSTVLGLHRWRHGKHVGGHTLGWAHPHGGGGSLN